MRRGVIHKKGVFCGRSWLRRGVIHKKGVFCGRSWLRRGVIHKKGWFCGRSWLGWGVVYKWVKGNLSGKIFLKIFGGDNFFGKEYF